VCAGTDVVCLAYPADEFFIELAQADYSEMVDEKPPGVRRCTLDARVLQFPSQVQV